MPKCPSCGQRTDGDFCRWCGYPIIMRGDSTGKAKAKKKVEQEAKERAMREAEEAKKAKEAEAKAKKKAEQTAKETAKRGAKEAVNAEPHRGIVKLTIVSPIDLGQVRKLEECLHQVQDLRLVLIGGSVAEGSEIIISAEKSIPLIDILREMPPVEQVVKKGKKIQIRLKPE
ncbi:MAG: hypothetical protein IMY77_00605 [Chloroflexi bacterium]|nr:hypothetical protein [Chloroflexota bacterium]